jgi:hypothetical protein
MNELQNFVLELSKIVKLLSVALSNEFNRVPFLQHFILFVTSDWVK